MASLPPTQRRAPPPQRASPSNNEQTEQSSRADATETPQRPDTTPQDVYKEKDQEQTLTQDTITRQKKPPQDEDDEPRKCWICFADETEDTPLSSEWRSPCPCALTAHESCLLDWIADLEAPSSRRSRRGKMQRIECPQCKSEIVVARPRNWVVEAVGKIEDCCSQAILPTVLLISASSVFRLSFEYGVRSIEVVFGPTDAYHLLEPLFEPPVSKKFNWRDVLSFWQTSLRLSAGLVSIPPLLVLSRTSVADGFLPILPMLFLATTPSPDPLANVGSWPPSAGVSFALLPYLRSAYNLYYEHVWADKEKKWLREIQPRAADAGVDNDGTDLGNAAANEVLEGDDHVIQIDLDFEVEELPGGDGNDIAGNEDMPLEELAGRVMPLHGAPINQAPPLHAPPLDQLGDDNAAGAQNAGEQAAGQQDGEFAAPAQQEVGNGRGLNLNISTNRLADTLLGALAFPFVSSLAGDVLSLAVPKAWTAAPGLNRKPAFFLQARWARSLVGGCLFVVLKDAVLLYVKWKMAQTHRKRRVLNYDKVRKRVIYP